MGFMGTGGAPLASFTGVREGSWGHSNLLPDLLHLWCPWAKIPVLGQLPGPQLNHPLRQAQTR